jgi:hypothetical protein
VPIVAGYWRSGYLLPFAAIAFVWFIVALRMWVGSHGRPEQALFSNVQLVSSILFIALLLEAAAAFSIDAAVTAVPAARQGARARARDAPGGDVRDRHLLQWSDTGDLPDSEEQETKLPILEAVMSELDDSSPPPSPARSKQKKLSPTATRAAPGDVVDPGTGPPAARASELLLFIAWKAAARS